MSSTTESSTEVRTLQSRATHAEKRAATLANQLSALQEASATHESRHQTAVSKWEARVREYEKRLREAGEMIKVEKQGGKERVADLEQQLRSVTSGRLLAGTD
jgi:predicted  nucleic acid-binding Zn-ribbon protein